MAKNSRQAASAQRESARRDATRAPRRGAAGGTLLGVFIGLVIGLGLAAGVAFYLGGGRSVYQAQVQVPKDVRDPAKGASPDKVAAGAAGNAAADKPRFDFYKILPGGEEPKIAPDGKPEPVKPDRALADKAHAVDKGGDKGTDRGTDKAGDKGSDRISDKGNEKPSDRTADKSQVRAAAPAGDHTAESAKLSDKSVTRSAAAAPAEPKSAGTRYWLQAGSFADEADAENLKARLALGGWEATVQQGVLADKSVRYRVRLGPYDNNEELARVKNQLAQRGYDSAALKY